MKVNHMRELFEKFDLFWREEEKKFPPLFQGELQKKGLKSFAKLAYINGAVEMGEMLSTPLDSK